MKQPAAEHRLLARVEELIGPDLAQVEAVFQRELSHPQPFVTDLLAHIGRFRGKRLRPILLLLTAQAAGEIRHAHHVLSAVVEMIHTATLVHDDVLDDAEIRRHVATVNHRWNNETSVLLGDYLFTHAFHLASSLDTTHACRTIGAATNRVCVGELMQIHQRGNFDLSEEEYYQIIDGKTAELCGLCGDLGARYADADDELCQAMFEYGRSLGIAFQIADDLLDLLGDEDDTGKTLGSDLDKQKLTLPLIRLLSVAAPSDAERIRGLLQQPGPAARDELRNQLERSDALAYAREKANEYARQGRICLARLPESPARRLLEDLTEFAAQRNF